MAKPVPDSDLRPTRKLKARPQAAGGAIGAAVEEQVTSGSTGGGSSSISFASAAAVLLLALVLIAFLHGNGERTSPCARYIEHTSLRAPSPARPATHALTMTRARTYHVYLAHTRWIWLYGIAPRGLLCAQAQRPVADAHTHTHCFTATLRRSTLQCVWVYWDYCVRK